MRWLKLISFMVVEDKVSMSAIMMQRRLLKTWDAAPLKKRKSIFIIPGVVLNTSPLLCCQQGGVKAWEQKSSVAGGPAIWRIFHKINIEIVKYHLWNPLVHAIELKESVIDSKLACFFEIIKHRILNLNTKCGKSNSSLKHFS